MADKIDFKKTMKVLFAPGRDFEIVKVPRLRFVMHDGEGDPDKSEAYQGGIAWLYAVSYALKFASKEQGRDYVVPPLEGLWWADDMSAFVKNERSAWKWRQMILVPDWITKPMFKAAVTKARGKLGEPPASLRLEDFEEGLSVQTLHVGSYADEAPVIKRLHEKVLPEQGLVENGHHHEVYLGDPRKVEPNKLKTILRQPVRRK